jgi:hypothetical protein
MGRLKAILVGVLAVFGALCLPVVIWGALHWQPPRQKVAAPVISPKAECTLALEAAGQIVIDARQTGPDQYECISNDGSGTGYAVASTVEIFSSGRFVVRDLRPVSGN